MVLQKQLGPPLHGAAERRPRCSPGRRFRARLLVTFAAGRGPLFPAACSAEGHYAFSVLPELEMTGGWRMRLRVSPGPARSSARACSPKLLRQVSPSQNASTTCLQPGPRTECESPSLPTEVATRKSTSPRDGSVFQRLADAPGRYVAVRAGCATGESRSPREGGERAELSRSASMGPVKEVSRRRADSAE